MTGHHASIANLIEGQLSDPAAGWSAQQTWADPRDYFNVQYLEHNLKQENKG